MPVATRRLFPTLALLLAACVRTQSPPPTSSSLTYFGVAGWSLATQNHTLLVDPYFTRANVTDNTLPLVPNAAAIAQSSPAQVDAILISHSHYDHFLDAPLISLHTGAPIVGTQSSYNLALASGVPRNQLALASGGETFQLGPFAVRAIRGLHSLTGQDDQEIPAGLSMPIAARDYHQGGTLQYLVKIPGHDILFISTANFIEENLVGIHPDIAIIATGLREKIPDYSCHLMRVLGNPPLVFTNHFDNWRGPLTPGRLDLDDDDRVDLADFAKEIHSCSPQTNVVIPVHLQRFDL